MTLRQRYDEVQTRVSDAAAGAGRNPSEIKIVAVAKTFPPHVILEAAREGIVEIGESRAQELKEKHAVIGEGVNWHFVGHLQTNKVRHVAGVARLIHSVDRPGLAEAIARRAARLGTDQEVLIEVNIARDPDRHGAEPERTLGLAEDVAALNGVQVRGLMGMAPFTDDAEETRPYFKELRGLRDGLLDRLPDATELSMGMTRDFEVAVQEGATIVRVGEAIFGPRKR